MQRKSGFLTFCFACLPGAGEMYLGYMKRGLSVMLAFWGLIFVASLLNMGILGILAPVIWAYSFFDTFNLLHNIFRIIDRDLMTFYDRKDIDSRIIYMTEYLRHSSCWS